MREKRVESMKEVSFSGLVMPMIAVYRNPEDFKGKCVVRVYDMDKPTDTVIVKDTLAEIDEDIRRSTFLQFIPRGAEDVPSLVGVWMY